MNIISIIPARLAASRFPNKPLAKIGNIPMVGHCFYRSRLINGVKKTYVATCDVEIFNYIKSISDAAIFTSPDHRRAATRTAEAVNIIEDLTEEKVDIVLMIQGDEPLVCPRDVEGMLKQFNDPEVDIVNLMAATDNLEFIRDTNNVKVVFNDKLDAMYFSREILPSIYGGASVSNRYIQTGIIAFRRDTLFKFDGSEESPLEVAESVDLNRVLENGGKIRMVKASRFSFGVDTPEELELANKLMSKDQYVALYK